MANQNDNPTIDDLDLSGIEGFGDVSVDETPIEVDDTPVEEPESSPTTDEGPISWSSLEKLVPEPLHEDLKPVVDEWRRQYERVLDETNPYRQIAARGVTQTDIETALGMREALVTDPRRFYDSMGQTYGWAQDQQRMAQQYAQYAQQAQAKPPANYPAPADEWDPFFTEEQPAAQAGGVDPQLMQAVQETQARLQQIEQMQMQEYQQRQQEQQLAFGRQQLDSELSSLEQKYGTFDKSEVVKRAIANATAGSDPSVVRAFHEMKDYEDRLRKQFVSSRPPKVMGSGSGTAPAVPADLSSDDAKRDAALALAIRLGAQAPGDWR
jgi:hypothetical protein